MEGCKIKMNDELGNEFYLSEITFTRNNEVVLMTASVKEHVGIFDKKLATIIVDFFNADSERTKLKFYIEE